MNFKNVYQAFYLKNESLIVILKIHLHKNKIYEIVSKWDFFFGLFAVFLEHLLSFRPYLYIWWNEVSPVNSSKGLSEFSWFLWRLPGSELQ